MQNIDTLINLIEAVKNHPKLFENTTQNDVQDDNNEWSAVAEECKMTIAEAQDQWNMLLLEYVEYLRNNQEFDLAQHMDFLQPYFFTIKDEEFIDEDELLDAIDSKNKKENNVSTIMATENLENNIETPIKINEKKSEEKLQNEISTKSNKQNTEEIKSTHTNSNEAHTQSNAFNNLSSMELIFLGYAKQLQKMPLKLQLKTKRKIADIMDEAELEMMS